MLLLPSCATVPRPGITLEAARQSLQVQYPDLLRNFDLHQGVFVVDEAVWNALSPSHRTLFLNQCAQSCYAITRRTHVVVRTEGDVLATFDGNNSVFYGGPLVTAAGLASDATPAAGAGAEGTASIPVLVSLPRPAYPAEALKARIEGTVVLSALVGPDGRVREIVPVDGGISILNDAAIVAARQAQFRPFLAGAGSDSVWVRIPMHFAIAGMQGQVCPSRPMDPVRW